MYGIDRPDASHLVYDNQPEIEGECLGDIDQETLDYIVQRAELMGVDFANPELMGGWLKRIIRKIRDRVRARRARRAEAKAAQGLPPEPKRYSLQVPGGGVSYSPAEGFDITSPIIAQRQLPVARTDTTKAAFTEMMKNPMMLALPLGAIALIALMKKK